MLGNVAGARQIFDRWMQWEPEVQQKNQNCARQILHRWMDAVVARSRTQTILKCNAQRIFYVSWAMIGMWKNKYHLFTTVRTTRGPRTSRWRCGTKKLTAHARYASVSWPLLLRNGSVSRSLLPRLHTQDLWALCTIGPDFFSFLFVCLASIAFPTAFF